MAAQPKKKISRVRGRTRRAHQAIKLPKVSACANCQALKPAHIACPECGFYAGRKTILTPADKRVQARLHTPKTTTKKSSTQAKTKAKAKAKSDAADITKSPDMETEPPKATEGKPVNARKRPVIGKSTTQATSDKARGSKQS